MFMIASLTNPLGSTSFPDIDLPQLSEGKTEPEANMPDVPDQKDIRRSKPWQRSMSEMGGLCANDIMSPLNFHGPAFNVNV
jgi:hypothetical protein